MPTLDRATEIALAVREAGGRALFVGGWVRDSLLNLKTKDIDLEIYGLPATTLRTLLESLGRIDAVGESFTVYKLDGIDITLPRTESKTGRGHRGFEVTGNPWLPIETAAQRRDFTVNAIAWDPLTSEYFDPHGGREDLRLGLIRAVDTNTFADDSLRVLRAIQLAARLNFKLDPSTKQICKEISLNDLPTERIWGELEKLLLLAHRPSVGFVLARELGVIEKLFPELEALAGCPQEPEWHPEGDVWTHTLMVVDQARKRISDLDFPQRVAVMLGAVCHDFGKPSTTATIDGRIRSLNHEAAGIPPTEAFLDRLNIWTFKGYDVRHQILGLVANHLKPGMWFKASDKVGDGAFRRLAQKVDLELLARLAKSDCLGRTGKFDCSAMDWFLTRARALGVEHNAPTALLRGKHLLALGLKPGPPVGKLLKKIYEYQLDGKISSEAEAIAEAKRLLASVKVPEETRRS
jgi:tRNA nucleotidyltransferase (CCA-adding enzyme)